MYFSVSSAQSGLGKKINPILGEEPKSRRFSMPQRYPMRSANQLQLDDIISRLQKKLA